MVKRGAQTGNVLIINRDQDIRWLVPREVLTRDRCTQPNSFNVSTCRRCYPREFNGTVKNRPAGTWLINPPRLLQLIRFPIRLMRFFSPAAAQLSAREKDPRVRNDVTEISPLFAKLDVRFCHPCGEIRDHGDSWKQGLDARLMPPVRVTISNVFLLFSPRLKLR